jgi:hypothetical protein
MAFTLNTSTISCVVGLSSSKSARQLDFRNDVYGIMMKKALKSNWARDPLMSMRDKVRCPNTSHSSWTGIGGLRERAVCQLSKVMNRGGSNKKGNVQEPDTQICAGSS